MPARDDQDPQRARQARRFALRFIAFSGMGLALYCFPYAPGGAIDAWLSAYLSAYARAAGFVLSQLEPGISVNGTSIVGRTALEIVKSCDAMETMVLFGAATLASEGRLPDRLFAAGVGLAALVSVNLARICSLYFVHIHMPTAFNTIHLEVWPPLLVALATLLFLACASWLQTRGTRVDHAA